jgi:hypothetical protein
MEVNIMKIVYFTFFAIILNMPLFSQTGNRYRNISDYYFPKNSFSERDDLDAFIQTWYGNHLDVLDNEKLIFQNNINVIRFTCLRTFHKPFSIKIMWNNINAKLIFNMSDGAGGYSPGALMSHFAKPLRNDQLNKLIEIVNRYNIFNQPTTINNDGLDGSQWIIEVNIDGNYKVIDRWTPRRGVVYDIGKYLIELSEEKIDTLY